MNDQLLGVFKICLLVLLYLFFARVLWAVWSEVRAPRNRAMATSRSGEPVTDASGTAPLPKPTRARGAEIGKLTVIEPRARRGTAYGIADELAIGRSPGCAISLPDDSFASTLHARVFREDGLVWVEDLGSTNGTFHNGSKLTAPVALSKGDRVQVGNTVLEAG